jgi:hypothetical protein
VVEKTEPKADLLREEASAPRDRARHPSQCAVTRPARTRSGKPNHGLSGTVTRHSQIRPPSEARFAAPIGSGVARPGEGDASAG